MFSPDDVVITAGSLLGLLVYAVCRMGRWPPRAFWPVQIAGSVAAVASSPLSCALFPAATEAGHHLVFLALSAPSTALLGARMCDWIDARERRRVKP